VGIKAIATVTTTTIAVAFQPAKPLHERLLFGGITGICLGAIASVAFIQYSFNQLKKPNEKST
jgi:hypothetical protein